MVKRLITILFLVTVVGNSMAGIPIYLAGEGECGAECCEAEHHLTDQDKSIAPISDVCCIIECPQPEETPASVTAFVDFKPQQRSGGAAKFISVPDQNSYLQRARFPVSPTRFLHGSSSRYLDFGSFLI